LSRYRFASSGDFGSSEKNHFLRQGKWEFRRILPVKKRGAKKIPGNGFEREFAYFIPFGLI